jgi:tetratricopeptide (TPR) repeat protein
VALTHLKKSIQVYQDMDHATSLNETYGNLGSLYNKLNDPKTAITYLNRSIAISDSINSDHISAKAYLSRSESHSQLGAYKAALDDFMMYNRLNDSIFNTTKSKQIEEMRALFEIEQKEQEIALKEKEIESLEQKAEISNLQRILLGAALVLSLLGFYGLRQKIKRNKLERAKIQAELAFKKKELTTHALNLARKNEVLEALKQKAKELKQSETDSKGYAQLIRTINFDLQDDNKWENFSRYFEDVHKDFNGNVKRKYPDVTSNELRLMALLKMNLSSKEIANILNISSDGIKKARQRLRKKMRLSPEDSLETTVMAI